MGGELPISGTARGISYGSKSGYCIPSTSFQTKHFTVIILTNSSYPISTIFSMWGTPLS